MSQESEVEQAVHRFSTAVVTMDIAQLMNDLMPEAMMKLQSAAGAGMAIQISDYEIVAHTQDGDDYLFDVKYIGPQTWTMRGRWSKVGSEWKIVDGDVIATE
jgi:hypothetical protein